MVFRIWGGKRDEAKTGPSNKVRANLWMIPLINTPSSSALVPHALVLKTRSEQFGILSGTMINNRQVNERAARRPSSTAPMTGKLMFLLRSSHDVMNQRCCKSNCSGDEKP